METCCDCEELENNYLQIILKWRVEMIGKVRLVLMVLPWTVQGNWDSWWTYEGISGPDYWGLINPDWTMCSKGKAQSPVNIDPG